MLSAAGSRPISKFSTCFTNALEHDGRAWAFLPSEHGGTFSDSGASSAAPSYWLQVHRTGAATNLRLYTADGAEMPTPVAKAIEQCR